ncbi:MAG: putative bifunctional diguanylate cyclase/phosphodiesterase [Thermoleophilaceae bacterium]
MSGEPSILLVDDDPENLLALDSALEPLGVERAHASSGYEALRLVLRHDFAVVLLAVQMPDMDGLETAAIVKRRQGSRDIPIIFIADREGGSPAAESRAYGVGAVDFITRPFDAELLRAKVRALVDLHRKESELRASDERFRAAFEFAPIGIGLFSPEGAWLDVNRALAELLGRPASELVAAPPFDLSAMAAAPLAELLAGTRRSFSIETTLQTARGQTIWTALHVSLVRDAAGEALHLICQVEDITERKRAEESLSARVAYLAYHDELTGLPNRSMFREHLDLAMARAARNATAIAVLYLDLNDFKLVNDSLGHAAGDALLGEASTRLTRAVRASDIVARVGGDEFIVLLADLQPAVALDAAELVAAAIHEALSTPFVISGAEFYVGTSIGIAARGVGDPDESGRDVGGLLEHADAAMYEAKQSATPTAVYTPPAAEPRDRLALTTRLRKTVERMDFVLHWLPVVDLDTQRVCGLEALMRWHDGDRGWVPPREFLALLEETGLIDRVGAWALGEAARCQADWRATGIELDVSVNISARQLWRKGAAEQMLDAITAAGGDPRCFVLEVAEATAARARDRSADALGDLRAAGVRIAVDDFAHSPLTALSQMEFDVLKLDAPLVAAADRPDGQTMINAIVQLARNLGIWPLAEGIETRRQYELLRGSGCRFGQGYFFAHALRADDVPEFVRRFHVEPELDPWVTWEASRLEASLT